MISILAVNTCHAVSLFRAVDGNEITLLRELKNRSKIWTSPPIDQSSLWQPFLFKMFFVFYLVFSKTAVMIETLKFCTYIKVVKP